jgi:hypothetical protein
MSSTLRPSGGAGVRAYCVYIRLLRRVNRLKVICDAMRTACGYAASRRRTPSRQILCTGKVTGEGAALALGAAHIEPAAVTLQGVLDDGKAEPGAALATGAARVDPVKALGQPRDVLGGMPMPVSITAK